LDKSVSDLMLEYLAIPVIFGVALVFMAVWEWLRWFGSVKVHPWYLTALAVLFVCLAAWRWRTVYRIVVDRMKGAEAEHQVGLQLAELRGMGYRVVHDVMLDPDADQPWNIDHVLVGPSGVYAIETKYRRKPGRGPARVDFDGTGLKFSTGYYDLEAVSQTTRAAVDLGNAIRREFSIPAWVRGVVVFPGWEANGSSKKDLWVLKPEALGKWLEVEERSPRFRVSDAERDRIVDWLRTLPVTDWED